MFMQEKNKYVITKRKKKEAKMFLVAVNLKSIYNNPFNLAFIWVGANLNNFTKHIVFYANLILCIPKRF